MFKTGLLFLLSLLVLSCGTNSNIKKDIILNQDSFTVKEVIKELNLARTSPQYYASLLEKELDKYNGLLYHDKESNRMIRTKEGAAVVQETIEFLKNKRPVQPVKVMYGLSLSAKDHVRDLGPKGIFGHRGSDGSSPMERIAKYGSFLGNGLVGESISFGLSTPRSIIMGLLVDDGVKDRAHRKSILNPKFSYVGAALGYHKKYGNMCVLNFASGFSQYSHIANSEFRNTNNKNIKR